MARPNSSTSLTRRSFMVTGTGLAAAGAAALCGKRAWSDPVRIIVGALPASSSVYLQIVQHMQLISQKCGYDITVQESAGTEENMIRLQNQAIDLGIVDAVTIKAKLGDNTSIRTFTFFDPIIWQFIVARDAGIKSLKDLDGKKFNGGPTGGGSTVITTKILDALNIKPDYFEGTLEDALDAYADRRIVGLSYRATGATATGGVVEAGASRPVSFVPFSDEEVATAIKLFPNLSKAYIEANVYPDQPEPIQSIGTWQSGVIGVRSDLPADQVYALIKAYFETIPEVAKTHKALARVTEEVTVRESTIPLHAGVVKYLRERSLEVPDRLIPPEAK